MGVLGVYTPSVSPSLYDFRKPIFNPTSWISSSSMKCIQQEWTYRIVVSEVPNSAGLANVYHPSPKKFGYHNSHPKVNSNFFFQVTNNGYCNSLCTVVILLVCYLGQSSHQEYRREFGSKTLITIRKPGPKGWGASLLGSSTQGSHF